MHGVMVVKPSGWWHLISSLLINVPEGVCHPLPPSSVLAIEKKKVAFIGSAVQRAGHRASGASNFPSFVWVIRGQPQSNWQWLHSALLMIFSSTRLPSSWGRNALLGKCVIGKLPQRQSDKVHCMLHTSWPIAGPALLRGREWKVHF